MITSFSHFSSRALLLLCVVPAFAWAQDPEPLRRDDAIEGRSFDYSERGFLERFGYRFEKSMEWAWINNPTGFLGQAGSTRNDEFYTEQFLVQRLPLSDRVLFDFRFRRSEDFDGVYDRNLIGLTYKLTPAWSLSALGDIVQAKEDIDNHFELAWQPAEGRRFRLACVLTDSQFNTKSSERQRYRIFPYTLFSEFLWRFHSGVQVQVWGNANPHSRLERERAGYDFVSDRFLAGARAQVPLCDAWWLEFDARGETGERDREPIPGGTATDETVRSLVRRHWETNLELHHRLRRDIELWVGVRRFHFTESDRRPFDALAEARIKRQENFAHCGAIWRITERVTFWPGLYLDHINNRELDQGVTDKDTGLKGKLNCPFDINFPRRSAVLTMNVSFEVERLAFAGGQAQIRVVF